MTSQPVDPSAAGAREAARNADGKFGTQPRPEGPDLQLVTPTPGSLDGYLPSGYENGGGFADFCGGCGDELTIQGECVACDGPFEESFRDGGKRYGLVANGDEIVVETSAYETVAAFRPAEHNLHTDAEIQAYAQGLVKERQDSGEGA